MSRVPRIRFKGFEEDWEQRKLGELATYFEYGLNVAAKEYDGENKYIRITDIDDESHEFRQDNLTSPDTDLSVFDKYKLSDGDLLLSRTGASVGKSYIYKASDGLVYYAGFLIRARIKEENNSEFVYQNTLTSKYVNFIKVTSMRSGQPGVNAQEYSQFEIMIPSKAEQDTITYYFSNLDHLITLHQSKSFESFFVDAACCTLSWEQRKLGEVVAFSKGSGYSKSDLKDSGIPVILYGRLYTNYETVIKEVDTFADSIGGAVYSKGGEIITPSSGETSEDISIASVVEKSGILLGGDLNIIYPQNFLDSIFIAISISNGKPHKDMAKRAQGKSVVHLHNGDLAQIEIDYPSIDEQTRISSYFHSLDHLITLHQLEPYYQIFKAIAYRIIDYAEYKFFNVKINLIYDIIRINIA